MPMIFCNNMNCEYNDEPIERVSDYRIVDGAVLCTSCYEEKEYNDEIASANFHLAEANLIREQEGISDAQF